MTFPKQPTNNAKETPLTCTSITKLSGLFSKSLSLSSFSCCPWAPWLPGMARGEAQDEEQLLN